MGNKDRAYDALILSLDSEIATLQDIEQDRFNLWSDTGDFIRSNGLIDAYYDYLKDLLEKEEGKKKGDVSHLKEEIGYLEEMGYLKD